MKLIMTAAMTGTEYADYTTSIINIFDDLTCTVRDTGLRECLWYFRKYECIYTSVINGNRLILECCEELSL